MSAYSVLRSDERMPIYSVKKPNINSVVAPMITENLKSFYGSIPVYNERNIPSFYRYALNPFSIPTDVVREWDSVDVTVPRLRASTKLTRTLSDYADVSPNAVLTSEQISNSKYNMLATADGFFKRFLVQSMLINMLVKHPVMRGMLTFGNLAIQVGGNALLKDVQIAKALKANNLTVENLETYERILSMPIVKEVAGKPKKPEKL